jgi:hypothetical protein
MTSGVSSVRPPCWVGKIFGQKSFTNYPSGGQLF